MWARCGCPLGTGNLDEKDRTAFAAFVRLVEATSQFEFLDVRKCGPSRPLHTVLLYADLMSRHEEPCQAALEARCGGHTDTSLQRMGASPGTLLTATLASPLNVQSAEEGFPTICGGCCQAAHPACEEGG